MKTRVFSLYVLLLCTTPLSPSRAEPPRTLSFQGILANPSGTPKPDGTYHVAFRLFDVATGGAALWTEPDTAVTISGGHGGFATKLGAPTSLSSLSFDKPYYLEIQVAGDPTPLAPRLALNSVPYALSLALPFYGTGSADLGVAFGVRNSAGNTAIAGTAGDPSGIFDVIFRPRAGVWGDSLAYHGVFGTSKAPDFYGVYGRNTVGPGVSGRSDTSTGVWGRSDSGNGVRAESNTGVAVYGVSTLAWASIWGTGPHNGVYGETSSAGDSGVFGENHQGGAGVSGLSVNGIGVQGTSTTNDGIVGRTSGSGKNGVYGYTTAPNTRGVYGRNEGGGAGVEGYATAGDGVRGTSTIATSAGVSGTSTTTGQGVWGWSEQGIGVKGVGANGDGVQGWAYVTGHAGVAGYNTGGGEGVWGRSDNGGPGVSGIGMKNDGVIGWSYADGASGVAGVNKGKGNGVYGRSDGGGYAGYFDGTIHVKVIEIAGGADVAERFPVSGGAEPGSVVAIDPEHPGSLTLARGAYNRKVAGIVSGANKLSAGMVLTDPTAPVEGALPIAMTGRVWVWCDATDRAIEPGDLLTTADRPGCAMAVEDYPRAQGATLGKAMSALAKGQNGLVLALVHLQ